MDERFEEWWEEEWWEKDGIKIGCDAGTAYVAFKAGWNSALASQWQPIETAPRDGTRIIVSSPNGSVWCDV